ncbi:bifunctional riboflavin kinase/FAD synthetase [Candidatus Poriferisocius sp.]|uniref:bifunctional riboflavin kinase/FAD synthetase n=1 Tax=Candidatus Poriferisocius sp. TaxID=3101276 RepID=UPI003B59BE29
MQVIEDFGYLDGNHKTVASIGVYDGVHLGHQAVIKQLLGEADRRSVAPAVVTFDRHPALVLRPENAPKLLNSLDQKLELLEAAGIEFVYLIKFSPERSHTMPEEFVRQVFVDRLRVQSVVVGEDFHFGRARLGNIDTLREFGHAMGFDVQAVTLLHHDEKWPEPVSSTAVRRALAGGDVRTAAAMLGRYHEIRGKVVLGDRRGKTIGFPTANIPVSMMMAWPADAVYAGWYTRPDGSRHMAAINIGRRPTFYQHAQESLLEAHLLDFDGSLYGEEARVEFVELLRSEHRFDGIDSLVRQLRVDVALTREILTAESSH